MNKISILYIAFLSIISSRNAYAQATTNDELDMPSHLWSVVENFIDGLETTLDDRLFGPTTDYADLSYLIFTGSVVFYLLIHLSFYVMGKYKIIDVITKAFFLVFVAGIFISYVTVVDTFFKGVEGTGDLIQASSLGSADSFAPTRYLFGSMAQYVIESSSFFDGAGRIFAIALFGIFLIILQALFLLAIVFVSIYPYIMFTALKVVGWPMVSFLLFKNTSNYFDGVIKQMFSVTLFYVLVKVVIVLLVLMFESAFGISYQAWSAGTLPFTAVPLDPGATTAMAVLVAFSLIGLVALFKCERVAAGIMQGREIGVGGAVGGAATSAAKAVGRAL